MELVKLVKRYGEKQKLHRNERENTNDEIKLKKKGELTERR